jgi:muramoyltetrapeptide carboxypeptidase
MKNPHQPKWPEGKHPLALAAPSGSFPWERFENGLMSLAGMLTQARIRLDQPVLQKQGYLAGDDKSRAAHFHKVMTQPNLDMVLCVRGGFGASRLLPLLDLDALAASQRLLVGFSDITCLLLPLAGRGLITVHGPVLTQLPNLDKASFQAMTDLIQGRPPWPMPLSGAPLGGGQVNAPLMGGNLTMLCHLLGTPWFPDLQGKILFLEDRGEPAYRLDRLLTQLHLAGIFKKVCGVAMGQLGGKGKDATDRKNAVTKNLKNLNMPVVMGLPFGHGSENMPVPVGAQAHLNGDTGILLAGADIG